MGPKEAKPLATKRPATSAAKTKIEEKDEFAPSPFSIESIRSGAMQSRIAKGFVLASGLVMALGFVLSSINSPSNIPGLGGGGGNSNVASVGNQTITGAKLGRELERQLQFAQMMGQTVGATDYLSTRQRALRSLTDRAAEVEAAQAAGVTVSEKEIDEKLEKDILESMEAQPGQSKAALRRMIETNYGSVDAYKEKIRKGADRNEIRNGLLIEKFEKKIKDENKVTEDDYKRSVTKLHLFNIVIRPKFPAANSKDFKAEQEKNNAAAGEKARAIFSKLLTTPNLAAFQAAARKESDDAATKAKGGELGWKLPSEVYSVPEIASTLEKSAAPLIGPLADAMGNQYIYFINGRKTELPKDFAKNKKKLLEDFETQRDNDALNKAKEEWKKTHVPMINDPVLAAYEIQSEKLFSATGDEQTKLRDDAISRYQSALSGRQGLEAAAINFQLAALYQNAGQKEKRLEALKAAVQERSEDVSLRLELARALRENNDKKGALEQLTAASKQLDEAPAGQASMFGGPNPKDMQRNQVAMEYELNKESKKAAAERAKIPPAPQGGMGNPFGGNFSMSPGG